MIETEEFGSFIDDELERTNDLFVKKIPAVFYW